MFLSYMRAKSRECFSLSFDPSLRDYFSECDVLWSRGMDAEGLMDTEHALFWPLWSLEVDTAERDGRGQSTRIGYGRDHHERCVLIVENVRELLGRSNPRIDRKSEQLVCKGVVVRSTAMASFRSRI